MSFFISGLRPTGFRGFGCDRCRGQEEGAVKGEETGSVPTDQRKGEQTTMFRGGSSQVQIPAPQREMGTPEAALRSKVLDPASAIQQRKTPLQVSFLFLDIPTFFQKTNPLRFHEGGSYVLYFSFANSAFSSASNSSFVWGVWCPFRQRRKSVSSSMWICFSSRSLS